MGACLILYDIPDSLAVCVRFDPKWCLPVRAVAPLYQRDTQQTAQAAKINIYINVATDVDRRNESTHVRRPGQAKRLQRSPKTELWRDPYQVRAKIHAMQRRWEIGKCSLRGRALIKGVDWDSMHLPSCHSWQSLRLPHTARRKPRFVCRTPFFSSWTRRREPRNGGNPFRRRVWKCVRRIKRYTARYVA